MFERLFKLKENATTLRAEVRGGLVTFLTLSYIIFVQPAILGQAGMDHEGVFFATCVCSAFACFLMAFSANYPFALAPAMGHNIFFTFIVCLGMGFTWQEALAANLIAGLTFLLLSFVGLREAVMHAVPDCLKYAIAVGIGLLIAFIGLQYGGLVQANPATLVQLGDLASPIALVTIGGIAVCALLISLRFRGAILVGILLTAVAAVIVSSGGLTYEVPAGREIITAEELDARQVNKPLDEPGILAATEVKLVLAEPPEEGKLLASPKWPEKTLLKFDFRSLFTQRHIWQVLLVIFIFFFLDMFDTVGTLVGLSDRAGFMVEGKLPRARQALFSDAAGTVAGTIFGTSTITTYVESAAGIASGARTGLANIITGLLLLAALFISPIVQMVGKGAILVNTQTGQEVFQVIAGTSTVVPLDKYPVIAPVLVIVGVMMMFSVSKIQWEDYTEAIPAFLTIVIMQFSLSITHGIAWGFVSYVFLKLVTGRIRQIHALVAVFAVLLIGMIVAQTVLSGR